jgi:hypothetical protein
MIIADHVNIIYVRALIKVMVRRIPLEMRAFLWHDNCCTELQWPRQKAARDGLCAGGQGVKR